MRAVTMAWALALSVLTAVTVRAHEADAPAAGAKNRDRRRPVHPRMRRRARAALPRRLRTTPARRPPRSRSDCRPATTRPRPSAPTSARRARSQRSAKARRRSARCYSRSPGACGGSSRRRRNSRSSPTASTLWIYQPEERQVLKAPVSAGFVSTTPVSFLAGVGRIKDDFDVEIDRRGCNAQRVYLKLMPKSSPDIGSLTLAVTRAGARHRRGGGDRPDRQRHDAQLLEPRAQRRVRRGRVSLRGAGRRRRGQRPRRAAPR